MKFENLKLLLFLGNAASPGRLNLMCCCGVVVLFVCFERRWGVFSVKTKIVQRKKSFLIESARMKASFLTESLQVV